MLYRKNLQETAAMFSERDSLLSITTPRFLSQRHENKDRVHKCFRTGPDTIILPHRRLLTIPLWGPALLNNSDTE
ncbi:hypothetical protein COCON_G00105980 [Conger conger]|uniref:Uncharacterized protein n=1 Tax=Conger conger TaxID=82655 RepID=A0A9Q1HZG9_CONCO|nr:hypothetical protein COCON_G00105980 [Conger conger]